MLLRLLGVRCRGLPGASPARADKRRARPSCCGSASPAFKITTPGGKVIMVDPWITGGTKSRPS